MVLRGDAPADQLLSRYFREHRNLGQNDRAFVAETVFAVLRRKRSLEAASGSSAPHALVAAALLRVLGHSARSMQGLIDEKLLARIRQTSTSELPAAVRADLPDWLWERLARQYGDEEALRIAHGLLNPAPLDLRVNLARVEREAARERLAADGIESKATPYSPAGLRVAGKPAINRHALFTQGLVEVQDEGSQLLAWLLAPRRGEMIADYCAGAGGKTLARGDADARHRAHLRDGRLGQAPRGARAARGASRDHQRPHAGARRGRCTRAQRWPGSSTACWSTRRAAASARCGAIRT